MHDRCWERHLLQLIIQYSLDTHETEKEQGEANDSGDTNYALIIPFHFFDNQKNPDFCFLAMTSGDLYIPFQFKFSK